MLNWDQYLDIQYDQQILLHVQPKLNFKKTNRIWYVLQITIVLAVQEVNSVEIRGH